MPQSKNDIRRSCYDENIPQNRLKNGEIDPISKQDKWSIPADWIF